MEDIRVRQDPAKQPQVLDQQRHRIHRDARREHRHEREGERIHRARLLIEAHAQILRHRPRLRPVVERHHEDADEAHRRDRADPVKVAGDDAVLGARSAHPDHLLRAQVGRDKRQPAHPGRDRPPRQKEVVRGAHVALQREPDAQNEDEIDQHDQPVDIGKVHFVYPWPRSPALNDTGFCGQLYMFAPGRVQRAVQRSAPGPLCISGATRKIL